MKSLLLLFPVISSLALFVTSSIVIPPPTDSSHNVSSLAPHNRIHYDIAEEIGKYLSPADIEAAKHTCQVWFHSFHLNPRNPDHAFYLYQQRVQCDQEHLHTLAELVPNIKLLATDARYPTTLIEQAHEKALEEYLEREDVPTSFIKKAAIEAGAKGELSILKLILRKVPVTQADMDKVLIESCKHGRSDIVEYLLDTMSFDITTKDKALIAAVSGNHIPIVHLLLGNHQHFMLLGLGEALDVAVENQYPEITQLILDSGFASVQSANRAIILAARQRDVSMLVMLLKFGARSDGALLTAVKTKNYAAVHELLKWVKNPTVVQKCIAEAESLGDSHLAELLSAKNSTGTPPENNTFGVRNFIRSLISPTKKRL
jgi:hypothetical protein